MKSSPVTTLASIPPVVSNRATMGTSQDIVALHRFKRSIEIQTSRQTQAENKESSWIFLRYFLFSPPGESATGTRAWIVLKARHSTRATIAAQSETHQKPAKLQ
jgi:hypothetical protein